MLQLLIKVLKIEFLINEKVFQKISFLSIIHNKQLFIITKIYLICKFVILNIKKKTNNIRRLSTRGHQWRRLGSLSAARKTRKQGVIWIGFFPSSLPCRRWGTLSPATREKHKQLFYFIFFSDLDLSGLFLNFSSSLWRLTALRSGHLWSDYREAEVVEWRRESWVSV